MIGGIPIILLINYYIGNLHNFSKSKYYIFIIIYISTFNAWLFRYEREINLGHRPILKKIMEQDDVSTKHMVLMVADIVSMTDSNGISSNYNRNKF